MTEEIGRRFQNETAYTRGELPQRDPSVSRPPGTFKEYPRSDTIKLPSKDVSQSMTLSEVLRRRKSIRSFSTESVSDKQLSFVLWASNGVREERGNMTFRTAPSAGGLYPIETYVVVNRVASIEPGIYHYNIHEHGLDTIHSGDAAVDTARVALDQRMCAAAGFVMIWTAVFGRSTWKYSQRAFRYIYLDAGHIAENCALACCSIGLGSCQIGALYDSEVNNLVEVDGDSESALYMTAAGIPL